MKYLLKQNKEDKGILCDKVTIDGFDYYLDYSQPIKVDKWYISNQAPRLCVKIKEGKYPYIHLNNKGEEIADFHTWKGVIICSNNPNIDIPQVVDDIKDLNILKSKWYDNQEEDKSEAFVFQYSGIVDDALEKGIILGYNKSQETHSFSEDDMIEFYKWVTEKHSVDITGKYSKMSTKKLLQLWKEQRTKIIYYNE